MRSIKIENKEILSILNSFKDIFYNDIETFTKNVKESCSDKNREDFISDEYLTKLIKMGSSHGGYPEVCKAYSLKETLSNKSKEENPSTENRIIYAKRYAELNSKLQTILSTYNNALCSVYPPGGFISWHNNANAPAYNLIFTWSENGDGYWKHIDPNTGEQVIVKDIPGWQCKAFYFGAYDDGPQDLVYHMASTDCWRMTISYVFSIKDSDRKNMKFLWDDVIEEIETP
jgi:hypothetical protein